MIVECRRCETDSCEDISYTYLASIECMHSFESSCRLTIFLDQYIWRDGSYPRKGPCSSVGEGDALKVDLHKGEVGIVRHAILLLEYTYSRVYAISSDTSISGVSDCYATDNSPATDEQPSKAHATYYPRSTRPHDFSSAQFIFVSVKIFTKNGKLE